MTGFRERNEIRGFHKLRQASSGRVLNLIKLAQDAAQAAADGGRSEVAIKPLFQNAVLNETILTKHNIRNHECDLFANSACVATKIFVPFNTKRLETGGRSFFIEETQFTDHLCDLLHLKLASGNEALLHDIAVLESLGRSPSLDPFIVAERLRADGFPVDPAFFSDSYGRIIKASADVFEVFKPLVQKALGKAASADEMSRFANQVWNVTAATSENLFLQALQIPQSEWAGVIFAWKALIYYDLSSRGTQERLDRVLTVLRNIVPKARISRDDQALIVKLKRDLALSLYRLHDGSTIYIRNTLQQLVAGFLGDGGAGVISETLRSMALNITAVGMKVVLFDQITSHLLHLHPEPGIHRVDAEDIENELANLCEIVTLRDGE